MGLCFSVALVACPSEEPTFWTLPRVGVTKAGPPGNTSPEVCVIGLGGDDRIFSGFASNFVRQPDEQKKYAFSS
jgi:hypothetical protein